MLYNPQSQAFMVSVYSQAPGQAPQWYLNHHHCHRRTTSYLSFWLKETSYYDDDHSGHGVLDFLSTPKNNHVHILTQENFTDKSISCRELDGAEVQLIFSQQSHPPMYHTLRGNVNNWSQFQFPSVAVSSVDYGGKFKSLLLISLEWSTFPFINVEKDKANCDASPDRIPLFIRSKMSLQNASSNHNPSSPCQHLHMCLRLRLQLVHCIKCQSNVL